MYHPCCTTHACLSQSAAVLVCLNPGRGGFLVCVTCDLQFLSASTLAGDFLPASLIPVTVWASSGLRQPAHSTAKQWVVTISFPMILNEPEDQKNCPTVSLMETLNCCCFKPVNFGVSCYAAKAH